MKIWDSVYICYSTVTCKIRKVFIELINNIELLHLSKLLPRLKVELIYQYYDLYLQFNSSCYLQIKRLLPTIQNPNGIQNPDAINHLKSIHVRILSCSDFEPLLDSDYDMRVWTSNVGKE